MTGVERQLLAHSESIRRESGEESLGILELIRKRFEPYFGMNQDELTELFEVNSSAKSAYALVTNRILGVGDKSTIAELDKAGAKPKTIRLRPNGTPKEAVSFPAIDYFELEETPFENSLFKEQLEQLYLFVVYQDAGDENYVLKDVFFWRMPEEDMPEAKRCYEQMQSNIKEGNAESSVKSSDNRCCHVRPHARNKADTLPQPHGEPVTKKCFWLNQSYLRDEIAKVMTAEK